MKSAKPLPSTPFFFVYGTLKEGFPNHYLLKPFVVSIKEAIVPGYILGMSGWIPFAIPDAVSHIRGEVIEIHSVNIPRVTEILDKLESEGSFYHRKEVVTTDGQKCSFYHIPQRFPGLSIIGSSYPPVEFGYWSKGYDWTWEEEEEEEEDLQ